MREAAIVSTARTPIGCAFKGSLNNTRSPSLMGHALRHAVARSRLEAGEIGDATMRVGGGMGAAALFEVA